MRKSKKPSVAETYFNNYFNRVPVSMMKLSEISKKIEQIVAEGTDIDSKMKLLVEQYREPT